MKLKTLVNKYKEYEKNELARRAAKRKKITTYKQLTKKNIPKVPIKKRIGKFNKIKFTKVIGNPYNVEL